MPPILQFKTLRLYLAVTFFYGIFSVHAADPDNPNLVQSPDLSDRKVWKINKGDEDYFASVEVNETRLISIQSPGRYCTLGQELKLKPDSAYRLFAEVKATGDIGIRVRARQAEQKKEEVARGFDLNFRKSEEFVALSTRFTTGPDGKAQLIIGLNENSGLGKFQVRNLKVIRDAGPESTGPAIPIKAGEPLIVTKLRVIDCRALRGFIGAPVDGSVKSGRWDGDFWEYNDRGAGAGVGYSYHDNDGLHISFADDQGFNAVVVRSGIKAKLLRDCAKYDDPTSGTLVCDFPGMTHNSRAFFEQPVKTGRVSFFDVSDGKIADCSFFRTRRFVESAKPNFYHMAVEQTPAEIGAPIKSHLESRFSPNNRAAFRCSFSDEPAKTETKLAVAANTCVHFISAPAEKEMPVAALRFSCKLSGNTAQTPFTLAIQDPLNPRLELHGADYEMSGSGELNIVCDFPDQIVPAGSRWWITARFGVPVTLIQPKIDLEIVSREQAETEALEHRKFLLKNFYCVMSEARHWTAFWRPEDIEKVFTKEKEYEPWVREILLTLDQCRTIDKDGKDDIVRQYYQWIYRSIQRKSKEGTPPFPTRFDKIDGVPEWAVLTHQAWMQAREIPKWWIENRMVANGELGGEVGDDTDMFGNYAAFSFFELDGVGAMVLDAGARLAATAETETLEQGLNRRTMDPLHAYEEGVNHEAQMLYWFYGDPVFTERCMIAARSTEALTILTPKGHRHFKSQNCGVADLRMNRKTDIDGQAHPQMWHPALELAWYNHNPKVLKMLREYADGWLEHQLPGKYAHAVDVASETATETAEEPLTGGYGGQAGVHTFLSDLTGDAKFVQPINDFIAAGKWGQYAGRHVPELIQMGMFKVPEEKCKEGLKQSWNAQLYLHGNKAPLVAELKKDIEELQRFKHMYTTVECFTDRVFLYALINPAIAYTGGFSTRNKINQTYAVSWDGFGTDYAALVTAASADHLKVLICNLSDKPLQGKARIWRLDHGMYDLTFGPDANGDDQADEVTVKQNAEFARASDIPIAMPKKGIYVLELKQTKKLDDIFMRADLAISKSETRIEGQTLRGIVHNLGSAEAEVVIALMDESGKAVQTMSLGKLAAPLDMVPKTVSFEFDNIPEGAKGWSVVVNPDKTVPEIYSGNNGVLINLVRR